MPSTKGFEIVAEITEEALLEIVRAAWKSGGDTSGEGVIPEYLELPDGLALGPYQLKDGTVQILQDQIDLEMDPAINGVHVTLGTIIHLEIEDPPVESATFFDITADISARIPVGNVDGSANLGLILSDMPADGLDVTITSGNPVTAILDAAIEEYVHQLFQENEATFPHVIEDIPVDLPPFSMLASVQFFDDESDPARRITVNHPAADQIEVDLPCQLRFYDIEGDFSGFSLASPMAVDATARVTADYTEAPSRVTATFSTAGVELVNIQPAAGTEGANYTANADLVDVARTFDPAIPTLEDAIALGFVTAATPIIRGLPDADISFPTLAELEDAMETEIRTELENRGQLMVWQPESSEDFEVDDVTPKVLADVLAIALNAGAGADADALENFIPGGCDFATMIDDEVVVEALNDSIAEQFPDGFPTRLPEEETDGRKVDLNSLNMSLADGFIRVTGDITVVDAILGSIDVDASFSAKVGLRWVDGADGGQTMEPFLLEDPDVDVDFSLLTWLLGFLTGFLLFGLVGGIIVLVIIAVVEGIASKLGAGIFRDALSGQLTGIEAWPNVLDDIGEVEARFKNPIEIFSNGILVSGTMTTTSTFAQTTIDFADSNGPYLQSAADPVDFDGGAELPESAASWEFGDGGASAQRSPSHTYGDSGLYVSKLQVAVNQNGGATTRHFAAVKLANVPPTVTLAGGITVEEGQEFEIVGTFTDPEWLDTHTARFDFGDNTRPVDAVVTETNLKPEARGEARASHTYCDNGRYTVRLIVEDDDGGIGEASAEVVVTNVAPEVKAPEEICVLVGQKVILRGSFTDPGWCDTHKATWDFGDCTEASAIVVETHEAPAATGTAEACHVYERCGTYEARLTVEDDDGGIGQAVTRVHAAVLENASLENGFRVVERRREDRDVVANEWYPYQAPFASLDSQALEAPREVRFLPNEFVCRDGQRAQRIDFRGTVQAGIYQTLCANPGWDYEFSARYHLPGDGTGRARIGIDPTGGTDPSSPEIVWVEAGPDDVWQPLAVRASATESRITLFMGGVERFGGRNTIYLDRAALCAIQPFCPEKPCERTCITFDGLDPEGVYRDPFEYRQLLVTPLGDEVFTTTIGDPAGELKLGFPPPGVRFDLPAPVDELTMTVNSYAGRTLEFKVWVGGSLAQQFTRIVDNEVKTIEISQPGMTAVAVSGGRFESSVVEICLCLPDEPEEEEPCEPRCVTFDDLEQGQVFTQAFQKDQVLFTPLGQEVSISPIGDPAGRLKLAFPRTGVRMDFPQPVDEVRLVVNNYAQPKIELTVFSGNTVSASFTELVDNEVKEILIQEAGTTAIEIRGGGNETSVVEVCLCLPDPSTPSTAPIPG